MSLISTRRPLTSPLLKIFVSSEVKDTEGVNAYGLLSSPYEFQGSGIIFSFCMEIFGGGTCSTCKGVVGNILIFSSEIDTPWCNEDALSPFSRM